MEDKENYYLVLKYALGITLKEKIDIMYNDFEEVNIINIFKQILEGLIYIHSNNIIHQDIKTDNILFD